MKTLIVADPLDALNPAADTGLTILRDSLDRGHEVYWATIENVILEGSRVVTHATAIESCDRKALPEASRDLTTFAVADFDLVWARKDPPVDWKYISMCWLLALEEVSTVIVNRPALLLRHHEKMVPFDAHRSGFLNADDIMPMYLMTSPTAKIAPEEKADEWVTKPWLGHGGRGVVKWDSLDAIQAARAGEESTNYELLQKFLPDVQKTGDRRLFYIGGEYVGDFVRMPAAGSIEANLAQGGSARLAPLTPKELDTVRRLGDYLKSVGIVLAGADMIAGRISEVNITAPTGFETFEELIGERLGQRLVGFVEYLVENDGQWPTLRPQE